MPRKFCEAIITFCMVVLFATAAITLPLGSYWTSVSCTALNLAGLFLLLIGVICIITLLRILGNYWPTRT